MNESVIRAELEHQWLDCSYESAGKIANRIAKKFPSQTGGSYVIDSNEKRLKALKWLPVEDVWGIGRRNAAKLQATGVYGVKLSILQVGLSESWVRKNMTITGVNLQRELNGIRCIDFVEEEKSKSYSVTRTFEKEYETWDEIKERVVAFNSQWPHRK